MYLGILLSAHNHAQVFQNVDDLQSFENISFSSSPEDLPGDLQLDLIISYGLKYYKYSHSSLDEVFEFKTSDINLGFNNEKLEYMDFYFPDLNNLDFDELRNKLEVRFGSATIVDAIEKGVTNSVQWKGQRVTIDLYKYGEDVIDTNDQNKTVLAFTLLN
ncbi:hypothetical protein [Fulvivirga lutea]|uniref:Uncharacterized protein n=1 Tax=Fulvivirga lutea TaxID=2810512 RepID=A0A974WKX7_9BACT|nr:hypothetical protein [Fulvivirga lutea]QSE98075.1 hypothetical protein JR347_03055 [Fulvivirga lutea]